MGFAASGRYNVALILVLTLSACFTVSEAYKGLSQVLLLLKGRVGCIAFELSKPATPRLATNDLALEGIALLNT